MFKCYDPNKGAVLVKNPNWSASTRPDPQAVRRTRSTSRSTRTRPASTSDLLAGNITGDIAGAGVAAASTQAKIVNDPTKKANADDALSGALAYVAISTKVKPLDNVDCRKAVEYGVDKVVGAELARWPAAWRRSPRRCCRRTWSATRSSTCTRPPNNAGDVAKAKAELAKCGKPNGFTDRPVGPW